MDRDVSLATERAGRRGGIQRDIGHARFLGLVIYLVIDIQPARGRPRVPRRRQAIPPGSRIRRRRSCAQDPEPECRRQVPAGRRRAERGRRRRPGTRRRSRDSGVSGDRYGYVFRADGSRSVYTDGAKRGRFDPYTDGAKVGKADPYTDGSRVGKKGPYVDGFGTLAGLDRSGVSSQPAHGRFDPYTDGAKAGKFDPTRRRAGLTPFFAPAALHRRQRRFPAPDARDVLLSHPADWPAFMPAFSFPAFPLFAAPSSRQVPSQPHQHAGRYSRCRAIIILAIASPTLLIPGPALISRRNKIMGIRCAAVGARLRSHRRRPAFQQGLDRKGESARRGAM